MPLNTPTKNLIEKLMKNKISFDNLSVEEYRKIASEFRQLAGPPEKVKKTESLVISGPNGNIKIRSYTPLSVKNDLYPALMYFSGSGFVNGENLDLQDSVCRSLSNATRSKVFAVAYRSAPEHKFPAGLNDSFAALCWVFENAKTLCIYPKKTAVCGYSSGGNFAALLAIKARDEGLPLAYQVLVCPCLDLSCSTHSHKVFSGGYVLDQDTIHWFYKHYLPDGVNLRDPTISPLWEKDLRDLAPALIISAEYDPLRDEAKLYADNLKQAGVPSQYSCYLGQFHLLLSCRGELQQEKNPIDEIGHVLINTFY